MFIARHKEKGGWYAVYHIAKSKRDDRSWQDVFLYRRIPINLKEGEDTNVLYERLVSDFVMEFEIQPGSVAPNPTNPLEGIKPAEQHDAVSNFFINNDEASLIKALAQDLKGL